MVLETLKDRIDIKKLTLEPFRPVGKAKFDPSQEISVRDIQLIWPGILSRSSDETYNSTVATNRLILATALDQKIDLEPALLGQLELLYQENVSWYVKLRGASRLKINSPSSTVDHFDKNPDDLKKLWDRLGSKPMDLEAHPEMSEAFLSNLWYFKVLYPRDEVQVKPSNQGWRKSFDYFNSLSLSEDNQETGGANPAIKLAMILSDLKWVFPEKFSEFSITDELWKKWKQKCRELRTKSLDGFVQLAAALCIVSAQQVNFDSKGFSLTYSSKIDSSEPSGLPKRRRF